jgi:hypothetical protein
LRRQPADWTDGGRNIPDGQATFEVGYKSIALNLHGMKLEPVERDLVTGGSSQAGERLAEQARSIQLNSFGKLAAEERSQEEVQLLLVADLDNAGVAKAACLTLAKGFK